jgi:hypothetical protein
LARASSSVKIALLASGGFSVSGAMLCAVLAAFPIPKQEPAKPVEMLIRLNVQPMPAPKPALRIHLLPEIREQEPGNPIPAYLKCLLDQDFSTNESNLGPAALRQADRAARLNKPDWQILLKLKTDGIGLLLPDLQKMRELASALQGRFREEIAQRRFDDANITAKTIFSLARHTGDHPTLIGNLVGLAIAMVGIQPFEEMLEQPGCPNYYWALTNLPNPLVSIASGMDGERVLMWGEFKELSNSEPMTAGQIKKVVEHVEYIRKFEPDRIKLTARQWINVRAKNEKYLSAARARLIESGIVEDKVARFPADQVILLDEVREFEVRRDEVSKYMRLATWEYEKYMAKTGPTPEPTLLDLLVPAYRRIRRAQGRLEQRIALLRHVEALRMFAAEHGKFPEKLDDVELPLPVDPFTGKPFRYVKEGNTIHLRGNPPIGEETNPAYNIHYEITIRK